MTKPETSFKHMVTLVKEYPAKAPGRHNHKALSE
jgi:hypothetical protein